MLRHLDPDQTAGAIHLSEVGECVDLLARPCCSGGCDDSADHAKTFFQHIGEDLELRFAADHLGQRLDFQAITQIGFVRAESAHRLVVTELEKFWKCKSKLAPD